MLVGTNSSNEWFELESLPSKLHYFFFTIKHWIMSSGFKIFAPDDIWMFPCRARVSCLSTSSWNATRLRRSTNPVTPASTALDSATAPTTRVSSSTQRPGHVDGVHLTSRAKLRSRWAAATLLSSNAPTMIRPPPHPAESSQAGPHNGCQSASEGL